MHPWHHANSSAAKWGGNPKEYMPIHSWFDESKMMMADVRHRALRHHSEGCFMCERIFGPTLVLSNGVHIPVRWISEQHIKEDLGFIPNVSDWFRQIEFLKWMMGSPSKTTKGEIK